MTLLERKGGSVGRKWVYIFNRRNGKKLIPGNAKATCEIRIFPFPTCPRTRKRRHPGASASAHPSAPPDLVVGDIPGGAARMLSARRSHTGCCLSFQGRRNGLKVQAQGKTLLWMEIPVDSSPSPGRGWKFVLKEHPRAPNGCYTFLPFRWH